ncbi:MAG: hypothetical protein COA79_11375 [Planctomycetota bacterium]|nr:MAG: hypothetical protein COA79_11375 [Planctomycetota bacterium]
MNKPKITVFTDPMPWGKEFLNERFRRIARFFRDIIWRKKRTSNHPKYRGHFAVTRSLIEGLSAINASFNYNPCFPWQLADTVVVLAGVKTLRQAIRLKQKGAIKKLIAGPNIVSFSSDFSSIISHSEIDIAIAPSVWVVDLYIKENPKLNNKIFPWPAGVDTTYWQPNPVSKQDRILILDKRTEKDDPTRVKPYVEYLLSQGWQVDVLVRCGSEGYTQDQYRNLLQQSCLMLGFTLGSESQGIAWAESWSTDVSTLILKNTASTLNGKSFDCSTAPYLCSKNGLFFDNFEDFKIQFNFWKTHSKEFEPRKWCLENMSDEVCASMLYKRIAE